MKTKVINLFGGPGIGKSTLAPELFVRFKRAKIRSELVLEYAKTWAWEKRRIGKYDQIYLLAKQSRKEAILYGNVDFVVTDSPLLLSGFYAQHYLDQSFIGDACLGFIDTSSSEVEHHNFLLKRNKAYDPKGRYETEAEAVEVDEKMRLWLDSRGIEYTFLDMPDESMADAIISRFIPYHSMKGNNHESV